MKRTILFVLGALVVMGAIAGVLVYAKWDTAVDLVSMAVNYVKYLNAPAGTTFTELAPGYNGDGTGETAPPSATPLPNVTADDWPSYNKTLTSERFSPLTQINKSTVSKLKVFCTYDTGQY